MPTARALLNKIDEIMNHAHTTPLTKIVTDGIYKGVVDMLTNSRWTMPTSDVENMIGSQDSYDVSDFEDSDAFQVVESDIKDAIVDNLEIDGSHVISSFNSGDVWQARTKYLTDEYNREGYVKFSTSQYFDDLGYTDIYGSEGNHILDYRYVYATGFHWSDFGKNSPIEYISGRDYMLSGALVAKEDIEDEAKRYLTEVLNNA